MVSKKASVTDGIDPEAIKGIEPINEKLTQLSETDKNPSFVDNSEGADIKRLRNKLINESPTEINMNIRWRPSL
ncbi:MAG: hypothetical protein N3D15_03470 [Syntrophorhabdaceae bacterium]|nr:hypothetical protein [Syntrophorhabdaceae bacterium]